MMLVVFTVLGFAALVVAYAVGIGGQVGAVITLFIIFNGALIWAWRPLIAWAEERLR